MTDVGVGVGTDASTTAQPSLTIQLTGTVGAYFAGVARGATLATVFEVRLQVDTNALAIGETGLTTQLTLALGTHLP